jgi:hypothetical protein
MSEPNRRSEEELAALLRALPSPPAAWVRAAQEVPVARRRLDEILERAGRDEAFARMLRADPQTALAGGDGTTDEAVLSALRVWLSSSEGASTGR